MPQERASELSCGMQDTVFVTGKEYLHSCARTLLTSSFTSRAFLQKLAYVVLFNTASGYIF